MSQQSITLLQHLDDPDDHDDRDDHDDLEKTDDKDDPDDNVSKNHDHKGWIQRSWWLRGPRQRRKRQGQGRHGWRRWVTNTNTNANTHM